MLGADSQTMERADWLRTLMIRFAIASAMLLCSGAALAVETSWRFDGSVSYVGGAWSQYVAEHAPVRGLVVLDRDQGYVEVGDPCVSLFRSFDAVRAAKFMIPGANGAGATLVPPGFDCAPDTCRLAVVASNAAPPPACSMAVSLISITSSPLASPQLGDVRLQLGIVPFVVSPSSYLMIPDAPWLALSTYGVIEPSDEPNPPNFLQLEIASLSRAQVCGDIDLDLDVDSTDVALVRARLADPTSTLPQGGESRCSVIGGASDCDVLDVAVIRRTLEPAPLGPGLFQICAGQSGG